MNATLLLSIMSMLPSLITTVESIVSTPGAGPQKLETVIGAIAPLVPAENFPEFTATVLPKIKMYISVLVQLYNLTHVFNK